MNKIIMSDEHPEINKSISDVGFEIIPTEDLEKLLPFERRHADIQCLKIENTYFVLNECQYLIKTLREAGKQVIETKSEISGKYPKNILLNAVYLNKRLYCKEPYLDYSVKKYCKTNKIELVNVNQGYTKCSTAVIGNYFITADEGIFNAMSSRGEKGLLIEAGEIKLPGVDYGFIGGCSFEYNNTLYFTGDIKKHKSYNILIDFCKENGIKTVCLTENILYDIGGFVVI